MTRMPLTTALLLAFGCGDATPASTTTPSGPPPIGWDLGNEIPNLVLSDQTGATVELHDFEGSPLLIDVLAQWCVPCQDSAPAYQAFWERRREDGLVVIAAMREDRFGDPPDTETLDEWVQAFGLTHPVLRSPSNEFPRVPSLPTAFYVDRELRVVGTEAGWSGQIDPTLEAFIDGVPGATEICDDGIDNDGNYAFDCGDTACRNHAGCDLVELPGSLPDCPGPPLVDSYIIDVATSVEVRVQTDAPGTAFDPQLFKARAVGLYASPLKIGDEETACDDPVPGFGCPVAMLGAGRHEIGVGRGNPAGCAGDTASYVLQFRGTARVTPALQDRAGLEL